jgi:hypothetical protein
VPFRLVSSLFKIKGTSYPLHEKLADWADAFLILPMDAYTLSYASIGSPGDPLTPHGCLLLRLLRCWDPSKTLLVGVDVKKSQARSPITKDQIVKFGRLLPFVRFLKWGEGGAFDTSLKVSDRAQAVLETLSSISGGYTWGVKSDIKSTKNEKGGRASASDEDDEAFLNSSMFNDGIRRRKGETTL